MAVAVAVADCASDDVGVVVTVELPAVPALPCAPFSEVSAPGDPAATAFAAIASASVFCTTVFASEAASTSDFALATAAWLTAPSPSP